MSCDREDRDSCEVHGTCSEVLEIRLGDILSDELVVLGAGSVGVGKLDSVGVEFQEQCTWQNRHSTAEFLSPGGHV